MSAGQGSVTSPSAAARHLREPSTELPGALEQYGLTDILRPCYRQQVNINYITFNIFKQVGPGCQLAPKNARIATRRPRTISGGANVREFKR
jgi:hypothetical protein